MIPRIGVAWENLKWCLESDRLPAWQLHFYIVWVRVVFKEWMLFHTSVFVKCVFLYETLSSVYSFFSLFIHAFQPFVVPFESLDLTCVRTGRCAGLIRQILDPSPGCWANGALCARIAAFIQYYWINYLKSALHAEFPIENWVIWFIMRLPHYNDKSSRLISLTLRRQTHVLSLQS